MSDLSIKEFVFRKGAAKRLPVSGTFELTPRCNLNCKMCYIRMTGEEQSKIGQELTAEEWINLGKEAVAHGMIYLLLTGGEPLLRQDFIRIYTSLIQMGLMITINTNATLLTPEIVNCFRKYRPDWVNVTLYGMSNDTYSRLCGNARGFDDAIRGICLLKDAGIRVNLNTTFTKYNVADMESIVRFSKENQIPVRMAGYIFPPISDRCQMDDVNLSPEEMGILAARFDIMTMDEEQKRRQSERIRKYLNREPMGNENKGQKVASCMAGRGAFWIAWNGKMYPCGMLPEYAVDVRTTTFAQAWQKNCDCVKNLFLPMECSRCKYEKACFVCAAVNTREHGVVSKMCERTRTYIKSFLSEVEI